MNENSSSEDEGADEGVGSEEEAEVETEVNARIGNFEWCQCGNCRGMETSTESVCCKGMEEIGGERFKGKDCISLAKEFGDVCLIM